MHKDNSKVSSNVLRSISEQLDIQPDISEKLIKELAAVVKRVVFEGYSELPQIQAVFATANVDANLSKLLAKLILDKVPHFKKTIIEETSNGESTRVLEWKILDIFDMGCVSEIMGDLVGKFFVGFGKGGPYENLPKMKAPVFVNFIGVEMLKYQQAIYI